MKKRNKLLIIICGAIVLCATLLLFFMNVSTREPVDMTALIFIILGEVVFFDGLIVVDHMAQSSSGTFLRAGGYSILGLYGTAAIVLSILFMTVFRSHIMLLVSLQVVSLAVAAILLLLIGGMAKNISESDAPALAAMSQMRDLHSQAALLAKQYRNEAFSEQLRDIADAIRYCDYSATVPEDKAIGEKLRILEQTLSGSPAVDSVTALCSEITALIQGRQESVKTTKLGGF